MSMNSQSFGESTGTGRLGIAAFHLSRIARHSSSIPRSAASGGGKYAAPIVRNAIAKATYGLMLNTTQSRRTREGSSSVTAGISSGRNMSTSNRRNSV